MADISKIILPNGDQHTIKDATARSGLSNKVDKVTGKGLSTNDFTDTLETKLNGIAAGAEVNVQSDWNVTDSASDAFIKNKPTIPTDTWKAFYGTCSTAAATAEKAITVSSDQNFSLKAGAVIGVKYSVSNSAENVKLNVNGTGAKSIWYNTSVYTGKSTDVCGYANRVYYYLYDGTHWCWIGFGIQPNSNTIPTAYCTTAAGTAAKAASCTNYNLLAKSYTILLISTTNTAASALTLNINGKGAKPIYINGTASSTSNHTMPAGSYLVYYDGTNYYIRTDGKITGSITGDAATVNGKTVAADVPANAKFTDTVVTKTSELTNDSNFAVDANYVHTDNNYTTTEKDKLAGIATGAEANVQSDWNVTDTSSDAFIKNKPTIPTVPSAATAKPVVDGTAAVGTSTKYAREDHVHPTDTSRAPESHASTATTYGLGDASNYGHVKLSDTYSSKVSNGDAAHGLAASQNALYNAYANRAPINHAQQASSPLTSTTYGIANETQYGHVMLTDKVRGFYHGQAKYGVAASSYALAELWNGTSTITIFAVYNHELKSKGIYIQRYHNSNLDGMAFVINKNAWLCMLTGIVEPTQQLAAGEFTLWTIPDDCAKFRPAQRVAVICQGSGLNRFLLVIDTDGTIKLDRYGTTGSAGPWPSGCWLNLYACYIACDDGFDWE